MKTNFLKTKKEITAWLRKYKITHYSLIKNAEYGYVVNVDKDVKLNGLSLGVIPVKFNVAAASFYCQNNQLTSLEFCPVIVAGYFDCTYNQLNSLDFCPQEVAGTFFFGNNPKLKKYQDIHDFSKLKQLIVIEKEQLALQALLTTKDKTKYIFKV